MTNHDKIRRGAMSYITVEILPLIEPGKGILVAALAPRVIDANLRKYSKLEWLSGTGLADENGFDVDEIYKLVKASSANKWPVEMFGVRFGETDLDKLYRHITEA